MRSELLPELAALEQAIDEGGRWLDAQVVCIVQDAGHALSVHAIGIGSRAADVPAVGIFGGVHGLERIGSRVAIAFLRAIVMRLQWDSTLQRMLERLRLVFMPLVNPAGMARGTRANASGVDLMRNAPVDALDRALFLAGGQRLTPWLPWYRGRFGAPMEPESAALCDLVQRELLCRPFAVAVDCHSGYGMVDRLWFPYAHRRLPFERLAEVHALHAIFSGSHPHHNYVFEPQSRHYLAHGDLWDHLSLLAVQDGRGVFLPLTLEMGSWLWVRKNPRQIFSALGIFNPLIAHREHRVLRRHMALLDFVLHAAAAWEQWLPRDHARDRHRRSAMARWYA